ncbi:MAG: glycosyl transferase family 2 [Planctomycetes bacterium]|nr:glycosyl transferase family 2 [Planctomycetota bacterium]
MPQPEVPADDPRDVDVTILLPAYNEEEAITPVIEEVRETMGGVDGTYEILVVDDCSTDRTGEIATELGARVLRRPQNGGSGASRKTGTHAARGEIVVMLDTDGSYTPGDIPEMLRWFPEFDQVNGARTSEEGTLKLLRVPAKWAIRKFACYLARRDIPDLNTGLKAYKRSIMLRYLWVVPDGFSCVTSMTLAFLTNGHSVKYIPTRYRKRIGKSKFHPLKDTQRYLATVFRMVMYFKPLRVFGPVSFLLLVGGLTKTVHDVWWIGAGIQESTIIIWMTAVMVLMLGLLADLIVAQKRLS